ncbi:MAG TPA: hypothetical protein VF787_26405 [Thermoanaerobaculia bacterium]
MPWVYREVTDGDVNVVLAGMLNVLNTLSSDESDTVKLAASNQFHGDARGLVVWFSGPRPIYGPAPRVQSWIRKTMTSDHNYTQMYDTLVLALNLMTLDQAVYVGISMTNAAKGDATLSWFFREGDHPSPIPINPIGF